MSRAHSIRLILVLCTGLIGADCGSSSSSSSRSTDEIEADFVALAVGDGRTEVRATLWTLDAFGNDDRNVILRDGDRLRARRIRPGGVESSRKRMQVEEDLGTTQYVTRFEGDDDDTRIEIEFERGRTGEVSAEDSFVRLPSPFTLRWVDSPNGANAAPVPFSRSSATPYFLAWTPSDAPAFEANDQLRFAVTGTCIQSFQGLIDWSGGEDSLQLTGVLSDALPPNDGQSCPLRVEFRLRRAGSVDSDLRGGTFGGIQRRVLELQSTP